MESKARSSPPPAGVCSPTLQTGCGVTTEWAILRLHTDFPGFQVTALVCPTLACRSPGMQVTGTHHLLVGFLKKCFSKDRDNEDIDDEGDKEGNAGLNEEVLIGFSHFLLIGPVHLPRLERRAAVIPTRSRLSVTAQKSAVSWRTEQTTDG